MRKIQDDLTGQVFGRLTVVERSRSSWLCACVCGATSTIPTGSLKSGRTKSCGCLQREQRHSLAGQVFGKWTVIEPADEVGYWKCECTCGTKRSVWRGSLHQGKSTSCGCQASQRVEDLTGQVFGRWTVTGRSLVRRYFWTCECVCGSQGDVNGYVLKRGASLSCGCFARDSSSARNTTHGGTRSLEYSTWRSMIGRTTYKSSIGWENYGGRGIKVCDRWLHSFENFLADMGPRTSRHHSIERIDNDGNYEPGNCRWATRTEQGRNQRTNRLLTVDDDTRCVSEWAELSGTTSPAICYRLANGWSVSEAVFVPADHGPVGEWNPMAKLTESDVVAIRSDSRTPTAIAEAYGLTPGAIRGIKSRRTWKHV